MILLHSSIKCNADAIGVPLQLVERPERSFIVRAATQLDAEATVDEHLRALQFETDNQDQPPLL